MCLEFLMWLCDLVGTVQRDFVIREQTTVMLHLTPDVLMHSLVQGASWLPVAQHYKWLNHHGFMSGLIFKKLGILPKITGVFLNLFFFIWALSSADLYTYLITPSFCKQYMAANLNRCWWRAEHPHFLINSSWCKLFFSNFLFFYFF